MATDDEDEVEEEEVDEDSEVESSVLVESEASFSDDFLFKISEDNLNSAELVVMGRFGSLADDDDEGEDVA